MQPTLLHVLLSQFLKANASCSTLPPIVFIFQLNDSGNYRVKELHHRTNQKAVPVKRAPS
jgi:hypothetical protein